MAHDPDFLRDPPPPSRCPSCFWIKRLCVCGRSRLEQAVIEHVSTRGAELESADYAANLQAAYNRALPDLRRRGILN